MATWFLILIAGWIGFGLGMSLTAYVLLTAYFWPGRINVERNVMAPQEYLQRML